MNDLIQLEMTMDEAVETDRLIKRHINTTRYLLLDMRDRKGWKTLGYESFKDYGEKELGYKETRIYQLVDAAEISLQLGYDSTIVESTPKESQLRPLKAVPEEDRKAIWEEATRKAEEEHAKLTAQRVQEAVNEWKQRNDEWRKKVGQLQTELDIAKAVLDQKPEPEIKVPDDYETLKETERELRNTLADVRQQQARIVNDQVRAKLQEHHQELEKLERDKETLEGIVERKKAYLDSLSSEVRRIETHREVINGSRLELIGLAAFLNDLEPISDSDTIQRWLALADMHEEAMKTIRLVFGSRRPELTIIHGDAA